ncbi:DUF2089 family protein [Rhodohalobacter sp. 8-1]|uniref:DUF2089 family protein n=1 Tax=Rhodohalobacter sp. 8-1 TaxID=3131972 RepID=UPI0030EE68E6
MENREKQLPVTCPSCGGDLNVKVLGCPNCRTEVSGDYDLPVLLRLSKDEVGFVLSFIKNSGSLKEMANEMGLSYPTVRNYLNELIEKIGRLEDDSDN